MIFFPFVYNVTDVLFNVNARGSLVGGNGVTVGGVGSITGVASGVEFGTSVAAGVGTPSRIYIQSPDYIGFAPR